MVTYNQKFVEYMDSQSHIIDQILKIQNDLFEKYDMDVPNIRLTYIRKLNSLEDKLNKDANFSLMSISKQDEFPPKVNHVGIAIRQDLCDKLKTFVYIVSSFMSSALEQQGEEETKGKNKYIKKLKQAIFRIKMFLQLGNKRKVLKGFDETEKEIHGINEDIENYEIKENIVEAMIKYIDRNIKTFPRFYEVNREYIRNTLKTLNLSDKFEEIDEKIKERVEEKNKKEEEDLDKFPYKSKVSDFIDKGSKGQGGQGTKRNKTQKGIRND